MDLLPHSKEMEQATLGSVFRNRDALLELSIILSSPDDFYIEAHAQIWAAMLECLDKRATPEIPVVAEVLRRRGQLDAVGGLGYLWDLPDACTSSASALIYAEAVADAAARRRAIIAAAKITRLASDESAPVGELHGKAQGEIDAALVRNRKRQGASLADVMSTIYEQQKSDHAPGVQTGYRDLDEITGGLQRSDLLILAARPRTGKTSLAMGIAEGVAELGGHVLVASLEMSRDQLGQRMIAGRTGIDTQRLRLRQIRDTQLTAVMEAMSSLAKLNIRVEDDASMTVSDIRALALREASIKGSLDLIVIDYLQLMQGSSKRGGDNRVQEVSEISRGLKALARELDVPILALSQLSRAVEARTSHVPMLSDLRESGSLEQDADIVLFIYREELYEPETDKKGVAEIHIAKHRNGPVGVIPMRFDAATTRFSTLSYRTPEGY